MRIWIYREANLHTSEDTPSRIRVQTLTISKDRAFFSPLFIWLTGLLIPVFPNHRLP